MLISGTVYLGSVFVEEALQRAIELTDAAYARTSERYKSSVVVKEQSDTRRSTNQHGVSTEKTKLSMFPG